MLEIYWTIHLVAQVRSAGARRRSYLESPGKREMSTSSGFGAISAALLFPGYDPVDALRGVVFELH